MNIYFEIPDLKSAAIALGCFDGIHLGHKSVIEVLNQPEYDKFCKAVFSFSDVPKFKNKAESIASFEDKCEILEKFGVSELILPSFDSIKNYPPEDFLFDILLKKLGASLLVCGENYRFGRKAAGDVNLLRSFCADHNIECIVVPSVMFRGEIISSSRIRTALRSGDIESASEMLGRQFSYCLKVVHGRKLGRQLGTPTINQYFPKDFLIPAYGVYASITNIDGINYPSVTNIGIKPTVGSSEPLSETWIIGYNGDLYGEYVRVSLVNFMRGEYKFPSIDLLKQAIHEDSIKSVSLTQAYLNKE